MVFALSNGNSVISVRPDSKVTSNSSDVFNAHLKYHCRTYRVYNRVMSSLEAVVVDTLSYINTVSHHVAGCGSAQCFLPAMEN